MSERSRFTKRLVAGVAAVALALAAFFAMRTPFPANDTPEGAYARIAKALGEDRPREVFPYLETEAQWACISIHDARQAEFDRVKRSYPPAERDALLAEIRDMAAAKDGEDVWVKTAESRGWLARLRKDLSGVTSVERAGDRATVVTARGTRYSFRRRDNGMWGLTMFTAELVGDRDKAQRDLDVVTLAGDDYDRARQ